MMKWTLNVRQANRHQEKGLIAIDLTFLDTPTLTLRFSDLARIDTALADSLSGVEHRLPSRFECAQRNGHYVLIVDGDAKVVLSLDEVKELRDDLKANDP